jgi:ribbon-helix-helix CopG family protein
MRAKARAVKQASVPMPEKSPGEPTVRLQIHVSRADLKKLKMLALERDTTMSELMRPFIEQLLRGR